MDLLDTWAPEWVSKPLRCAVLGGLGSNPLQDFTAQWELLWEAVAVILVSSTEVPAKFTALFTPLGCRQSYAFYQANTHTLLVVTQCLQHFGSLM